MRKLVVIEFTTLDNVIQSPGNPEEDTSGEFEYGGWIAPYSDEVISKTMSQQMKPPFDLLLGRKTYEIWAAYWPSHSDRWPSINEAKKYVASHKDRKFDWINTYHIKGDVVEEVQKLKAQNGPMLQTYGSGNLVQTLMKHDLVDEFWLKIYPITLGRGKRLFAEGTVPAAFTLDDLKKSTKGVIIASYKRKGKVKSGSL